VTPAAAAPSNSDGVPVSVLAGAVVGTALVTGLLVGAAAFVLPQRLRRRTLVGSRGADAATGGGRKGLAAVPWGAPALPLSRSGGGGGRGGGRRSVTTLNPLSGVA
jgi:hypothetical protein